MTTSPSLHEDLPTHVRRQTTADLFKLAAETTGAERERAIEGVILANTGVARSVARRYVNRGVPLEDLEQVAYLALVKAAHRFEESRGEDFLVFAVPTMTGELRRWFRDQGWMVRPPRGLQELQGAAMRASTEAGRDLTAAEIAEQLDVPESSVREALGVKGCFNASSLDAPLRADAETPYTLADTLVSGDDDMEASTTRLALDAALATLEPRERLIVRLRYMEGMTQAEIGDVIGVTQTQVSRLLTQVRKALREQLADLVA